MAKISFKFYLVVLLMIGFLISPAFSHADSAITIQPTDIQIETIPTNPEPYQLVTIKLTSYSTDLNKAMITWKSRGSVISSGYGKTSYSFTASGPNTNMIFSILINPAGSMTSITKQVGISPSVVSLLWEAVDSYTPPFYKGKALLSRQGKIRVVAIPTTASTSGEGNNITYTWKLNDQTHQEVSGYNQNSYTFPNNVLDKSENVSVTASSVDGSYQATNSINISTYNPKILFYKKSPTEGVLYNKALVDGAKIYKEEETITAIPYYLSLKGNESNFNYNWQINGNSTDTPNPPMELTIKPTSTSGYATISLTIQNLKTLFQDVTGQLKLSL